MDISLELLSISDVTRLNLLRSIDTKGDLLITPETCFWAASVECEDENAFLNFIKLADQENIQELIKINGFGPHMAYAFLVRNSRSEKKFHLLIFEQRADLWANPELIFAKLVSMELTVTAKPEKPLSPQINAYLESITKLTFWEYCKVAIKTIFKW